MNLAMWPSKRRSLAGHGILVDTNARAHLLGIERSRQRGRAHKIDEHHGQLPPLSCRRPRRGWGLGWGTRSCLLRPSGLGQRGNGF